MDNNYDSESYDNLISAEVRLQRNDKIETGVVIERKRDSSGNFIGNSNANPILDTRVYTVQFPDGSFSDYAANIIAENIFSQVDFEGNQYQLIDEIVDHRISDKNINSDTKFKVLWKNNSSDWITLNDIKKSNPLELSDYIYYKDLQVNFKKTVQTFKTHFGHFLLQTC